jgi:guanylate kinase
MKTIKNKLANKHKIVTIFIKLKNLKTIIKRMIDRGSETEESIKIRLNSAKMEMKQIDKFDHIILNDDLDTATNEFSNILKNNI